MGRDVGGGIGMGKTCEPKAFSFQCMTKFTTKKKNRIYYIEIYMLKKKKNVLVSDEKQSQSVSIYPSTLF